MKFSIVGKIIILLIILIILIILINFGDCSYYARFNYNKHNSVIKLCDLPFFYVLENIEEKHRKSVINGFDYWNITLKREMFASLKDKDKNNKKISNRIITVKQLDKLDEKYNIKGIINCGLAFVKSFKNGCVKKSEIHLKSSCMRGPLVTETLVRHEVGHFVGLVNSNNPNHLMYYGILFKRKKYMIVSKKLPINATESEIKKINELYE